MHNGTTLSLNVSSLTDIYVAAATEGKFVRQNVKTKLFFFKLTVCNGVVINT